MKVILPAILLALTWCGASLQVRADTLVITGQYNLFPIAVDFLPVGNANGDTTVSVGSTGIFAGLVGTAGTVKDLNFTVVNPLNQPFFLPSFLTFAANPNLRLDLTFINLGTFSPANCGAVPAVGQMCTPMSVALISPANPGGLTPYNMTNIPGGNSTLSFTVLGLLVNGATTTPLPVTFTTTFNVPYQTVLANFATPGFVNGTYFGAFTTTPDTVPEPTTMLLLGSGLAGIAVKVRRRRKTR